MTTIVEAIRYNKVLKNFSSLAQWVHIITFEQNINNNLTLLISKVSEAICPNTEGNHIGEGACIDDFLVKQEGVRFIINGGFNHYRKNFYDWPHQNFNVGDPVGLVKIREHYFEDFHNLDNYGFLVQKDKKSLWTIKDKNHLDLNCKYILGCTPLLIFNGQALDIPEQLMQPIEKGKINPPSILAHGLQSHPRTAVGVKDDSLVFICIEGVDNKGATLLELQQLGQELHLDSLLNLDGGGSSQFRLFCDNAILSNSINPQDSKRVLGNVLVIFDEILKP